MKKIPFNLLILLFVTSIVSCKKEMRPGAPVNKKEVMKSNFGGNIWTQLAVPVINVTGPPPLNESNIPFSANNKLYVVLPGFNQLWQYDPSVPQWTLVQSPFYSSPLTPADLKYLFTYGTAIYFLNNDTKVMRQYNLSTGQWSSRANFPGTATSGISPTFTATKGYIMAGANGADANGVAYTLSENWEYDFVTDSWTAKTSVPGSARYNAAAYAVGDKVYFGLGISVRLLFHPNFTVSRNPIIDADWYEFNTTTNTWTQKASYGGGVRQDTRGFVIGSNVYVGMGTAGYFTDLRSDLWAYDPTANTWAQRASYPPGAVYPPWFSMAGAGGQGFAINDDIQAFWSYTALYPLFFPTSIGTGASIPSLQP